MSPFLVGLLLLAAGLAGVFWGYRIFRILLPIFGGFAGYLIALALFPNNLILALVIGFGLAFVLVLLAYTAWSIMVTISGVILGGSLGAAIAEGLNLWNWLGWIVILVLAVLGGILVWKIRDEVVIILTAITGAAFVATGLRAWFGEGTVRSTLWFVIFIVLAIIGIAWQWRRYRHLELLGMGGPAETPGATRAAPVADVGAPVAAAPAAPAVAAAPATTAAVAAGAVVAAAAVESPAEQPAAPEVAVEQPVAEMAETGMEAVPPEASRMAAAGLGAAVAAETMEAEAPVAETMGAAVALEAAEQAEPATEMAETIAETVQTSAADLKAEIAEFLGLEVEDIAKFTAGLEYVEGIGPVYAEKLKAVGIDTLYALLKKGAMPKGRTELAEQSGISGTLLLKWINHIDLYRVKGIGSEYADLLEASGVDTVVELATRNAANLFEKMNAVNAEKNLVRRTPFQSQVEGWVEQAKKLPRVINY